MRTQKHFISTGVLLAILLGLSTEQVTATVRIKDITSVRGVRDNQLTGVGFVTGLDGTGGNSPITRQYAQNFLQRFGIRASPTGRLGIATDTTQLTDNVSVVTVTALLPIFAKDGQTIDVSVAALDDAESLLGGVLMTTPLRGVDNCVYAVASGHVSVGGFSFEGAAASARKNHPTTGRIAGGGIVEKTVPFEFGKFGAFELQLNESDFVNAQRVSMAINNAYPGVADPVDAATIRVLVPPQFITNPIAFVGSVRSLIVQPDTVARVVINERTGTVVVGGNVRISPVGVTHANLNVVTAETPEVSQPNPLSDGVTAVVPRTDLGVTEERRPIHLIGQTTTVSDLAQALNALGVTPRDLSAIFQQLKTVGALHADLEFH